MKKGAKILIGLDEWENKFVNYCKAKYSLVTKEEAVKKMIREWAKQNLIPEIEKDLLKK